MKMHDLHVRIEDVFLQFLFIRTSKKEKKYDLFIERIPLISSKPLIAPYGEFDHDNTFRLYLKDDSDNTYYPRSSPCFEIQNMLARVLDLEEFRGAEIMEVESEGISLLSREEIAIGLKIDVSLISVF